MRASATTISIARGDAGQMKSKSFYLLMTFATVVALLATTAVTFAAGSRVRVVHASPDAPAVDVLVNGSAAFTNAPFKGITNYAALDAGSYSVAVVPTGATEPQVISATLALDPDRDYTVVAVGQLANIEPLVLTDNNAAPAAGKAHVRFVHASPDAPAVDIAVKGGPVIFSNVAFKGVGDYTPVDAGTYDLEVRLAGTETVALDLPGIALGDGTVYTVFAMGLAGGEPALTAVLSEDAQPAAASSGLAPAALPTTGGETNILLVLMATGVALLVIGGAQRLATQKR
jgi:hypothetical protein